MTLPTVGGVVASIVTRATHLRDRIERAHRNALTISYLQDMPAYLRSDIGLAPGAEIRSFVENGQKPDNAGQPMDNSPPSVSWAA